MTKEQISSFNSILKTTHCFLLQQRREIPQLTMLLKPSVCYCRSSSINSTPSSYLLQRILNFLLIFQLKYYEKILDVCRHSVSQFILRSFSFLKITWQLDYFSKYFNFFYNFMEEFSSNFFWEILESSWLVFWIVLLRAQQRYSNFIELEGYFLCFTNPWRWPILLSFKNPQKSLDKLDYSNPR